MKIVLEGGDKAPGLFREQVITDPDLDVGGIYVFVIDRKYLKLGSAKVMRKGIQTELAGFGKDIVTKKSTVEVFCLENDDFSKEKRLKLRNHWLGVFRSKAPKGMLLNAPVINVGTGKHLRAEDNRTAKDMRKLAFKFDPKKNKWTQSLACLVTLQNPKTKQFRVNAEKLQPLVAKGGKRFKTYYETLDYLHEKGWFTVGMSFFAPAELPKTQWNKFLDDSETKKVFK